MNLHPYLTPELLALIRTAKPEDIAHRLEYCYNDGRDDVEVARLGFRVEAKRSGGRRIGLNLPISYDGFAFSSGYQGMKRRVDLKVTNWRELFITRFNEVLHDCEAREQLSIARRDANAVREQLVKTRKVAVIPLLEPLPLCCSWNCDNRQTITESLRIDTIAFTPEQIKQITDLVRSFTTP